MRELYQVRERLFADKNEAARYADRVGAFLITVIKNPTEAQILEWSRQNIPL